MAGSKKNGSTVPDWFKTAEPGMMLRAVAAFEVKPANDSQRHFFGSKVRISSIGHGRLVEKGEDTVTVIFEEHMHKSGGPVEGKIAVDHPARFKPVG